MSGPKMETTKEALVLFLKSLPSDAHFDIVSFGNKFVHMCNESSDGFAYTDKNVERAVAEVKGMSADMGGTEIFEPLQSVVSLMTKVSPRSTKKLFLLTDGEVSSPERVIELARTAAKDGDCKIHTFGIGRDCSVDLVTKVASAGRGSCSLVFENKDLRSTVIMALQRADEPQYSNTFVRFTPQPQMPYTSLGNISGDKFEIFRNDALIVGGLMKADIF